MAVRIKRNPKIDKTLKRWVRHYGFSPRETAAIECHVYGLDIEQSLARMRVARGTYDVLIFRALTKSNYASRAKLVAAFYRNALGEPFRRSRRR